jgi:hypothetical protein
MERLRFKRFFEATDIFGFDAEHAGEDADDKINSKPIVQFDLELMMEFLGRKTVGNYEPSKPFINEIIWGKHPRGAIVPGAIKLEVDTGLTFYIKKMGVDKLGEPRWVTKRMFQLNRNGYGGLEDSVAEEVHEHIIRAFDSNIDAPKEGYTDLDNLVTHIYNKMKRTSKNIFIPVGIKKLQEHAYVISFEVRGHGVEAQDQKRVEQNQTVISYDQEQGTIRVFNYNIESPMSGHKWEIMENDLDLYFFPTQDREEISECLAVHMKYY